MSLGAPQLGVISEKGLKPWKNLPDQVSSSVDIKSLTPLTSSCVGDTIMPAHPQGGTKLYHLFEVAIYDPTKLEASDPGCLIGSKGKNKQGVHACLSPDKLYHAVLSDTYVDTCGNYYRGFWEVTFLKSQENMSTLVSKGRNLRQKKGSSIKGDLEMGPASPVPLTELLFLTPLFKGDLEKIQKYQRP